METKEKKTFAQKYSKKFESLLLDVVNDTLKNDFEVIASVNTPEKSDGGYDGYCIIKKSDNEEITTLLEAKLRTICKDLPLNDFSKSIIIAINLEVACIVIGTNLFFTQKSIEQLKQFRFNTGLDIRTIDNRDILNWMSNNENKCEKYGKIFIKQLRKYAEKNYENASRSLSLMENSIFDYQNDDDIYLYGTERKRIRNKIVSDINEGFHTFVIIGEKGTGKNTLVNSVLHMIKVNTINERKTLMVVNKIDMGKIGSHNDFIITIISSLWGCSYDETINFLENIADEKSKVLISKLIPEKVLKLLNLLSNNRNNIIDIDVFYSYINALYCKSLKEQRIKRIIYFHNIENSNYESLHELITFIRKMSGVLSIILCTTNEKPHNISINEWSHILNSIYDSKNIILYTLKEWKKDDAIKYLTDNTNDNEISNCANEIIDYFGKNPACISAGIELIKKDKSILSLIRNGRFKLDSSFDVNKLRSAFILVSKNFDDFQLIIIYLLLLIEEKIEFEFIKKILNIDEQMLFEKIKNIPLLKYDNSLYWKNRFYADLFCEDDFIFNFPPTIEKRLLTRIISNINLLNLSNSHIDILLIKIYIKLKKTSETKLVAQPLIAKMKHYEQYTNLYYITCMLTDSELFDFDLNFIINLRLDLLESAMKIGMNGDDTDFYSRYKVLKKIIDDYCYKRDGIANTLLVGKFYYISSLFNLTNSNYKIMKEDCNNGLKYLETIASQEALILKSELCANYAVAIKHLSNIEDCVNFLEKNNIIALQPEISRMPKYQISYHTHHASLFTGSDPKRALDEFLSIDEICRQYSKEAYLHNLHNISSMQLILDKDKEALSNTQIVYEQAYEFNIIVEFGRCQNVLGCLMWKQRLYEKAKHYFICSYKHFQKHQHNTHVWAPLVNLAILCTENKDDEAYKYTKEAYYFLKKNHIDQIRNARIENISIPKITVAVLMIIRCFELLDRNFSGIQELFEMMPNKKIQMLYSYYIKDKSMDQLFIGTSYNCAGIVMLKV